MAFAAVKTKEREFTVPSLAEASPQYAELAARKTTLLAQKLEVEAEILRVFRALRAPAARTYSDRVAELIGEEVPSGDAVRPTQGRLIERERHLQSITQAIAVIESRLGSERGKASLIICDQ